MRTSAARRTAGSVAVASVALMAAGLALAFADRHHVPPSLTNWDFSDVFGDAEDLSIPFFAYLVASRRPRNPIGWLALMAGLVLAASTFCTSYALHAIYAAPGSLPGARAALWIVNSFALVPIGTVVFLFLLFPTGRLRSRRWVPVAWFEAAILAFALVLSIVEATRYYSRPFAMYGGGQAPALLQVENLLIPVAILLSVISLIVRFVKSAGDERLQLKWFATAAVLVLLTIIPAALTNSAAATVLLNVALFCMNGAIALAVFKYRLYDIDIVISKAVRRAGRVHHRGLRGAGSGRRRGRRRSAQRVFVGAGGGGGGGRLPAGPAARRLGRQPARLRPPRDPVPGTVAVRAPDRRRLRRR